MYQLSLVGHNSTYVQLTSGIEVQKFIRDIDQVPSTLGMYHILAEV